MIVAALPGNAATLILKIPGRAVHRGHDLVEAAKYADPPGSVAI
jgi:hypothetical protein